MDNNEIGALQPLADRAFVPSGSSPQAVSPVPASIPSAGDWVLYRTGSNFDPIRVEIKQAEKVTLKQVKFVGRSWPRQANLVAVVAFMPSKEGAERLRDAIGGVAGEYTRRRQAADADRSRRVIEARKAADLAVEKLVAKATGAA